MKNIRHIILEKIYESERPITWYQLERMLRAKQLIPADTDLGNLLADMEVENLIFQQSNNGKPQVLRITDEGKSKLLGDE